MGKTYKNTPVALPDIFRPIVAEVSANLASESSLNIDQVSFIHGTLLDISSELQSWAKDPTKKDIVFPLVCLLYKAEEKFVDEHEPNISPDILICTNTKTDYNNNDRYEINFKPILYPIYAELKAVIAKSSMFSGYNKKFKHTKVDLPHAGQESAQGNVAYELQDVIDGVYMKGVELKVATKKCAYIQPNICVLTPCKYGLDWYFYTIFKNVTFSGVETAIITASVNEWGHLDNTVPMALPLPWAPEIDWQGDGNFQPMTAGATPVDPWTSSFNVTTGYGNGSYRGVIKNGNAQVEFYYKVFNNSVIQLMDSITQDIDFSIACADYPNYPVTVDASASFVKAASEPYILNGYGLQIFGVTKATLTFPVTASVTKQVVTTLDHGQSNQSVINNFSYNGGQSPLQQISIIKTRCKTSF